MDPNSKIIPMSVGKYLALLVSLAVIALVCAGVAYVGWQQGKMPVTPVLAIAACCLGVPFVLFQLFVGQTLILGSKYLEWLHGGKTIGRIPFGNIHGVDIYQTGPTHAIRIMLIDGKNRETFWPRGERGLHAGRKAVLIEPDCDIRLPAIWRVSAESIVNRIATRLSR
jgi:hypothetical protein